MNKTKVYFSGIDGWNRPVFRSIFNSREYYCDVYNLFDYNETEAVVLAFYEVRGTASICYKGTMFDSEPDGDPADVEIVTRKEAAELHRKEKEE